MTGYTVKWMITTCSTMMGKSLMPQISPGIGWLYQKSYNMDGDKSSFSLNTILFFKKVNNARPIKQLKINYTA